MAEIGGTKPDVSELHWNDGGTPEPATEPSEAKKDDGFPFEDIPPASEENWWRKRTGEVANWLEGAHTREFENLSEAIVATSYPETFKIRPPAGGMNDRGGSVFSVLGGGGAGPPITDSCTDGERYYYIQGTTVYAANTLTGATLWQVNPGTSGAAIAIDCDGANVIVAYPYTVTGNEVFILNPANGATIDVINTGASATQAVIDLASNGKYLTILRFATATSAEAEVWDITGTPVMVWLLTAVGGVGTYKGKIVVDDEYAYLVFSDEYRKISFGAGAWTGFSSFTYFTGVTDFNCIACDGLRVYIVTDRNALIAGGNANVLCVNRETQALVYSRDLGAYDIESCCIDENFLYFSILVPSILTGAVEKYDCVYTFGTFGGIFMKGHGCDGISFFGTDNASSITRNWKGTRSKVYMRALGTDYNRRPYYNLAVPMGDEV